MYKSLNFQGYLNIDQLPRQVHIFRHIVNLEILEENLHDGIAVFGDSFLMFLIFPMQIVALDVYYFYVVMH